MNKKLYVFLIAPLILAESSRAMEMCSMSMLIAVDAYGIPIMPPLSNGTPHPLNKLVNYDATYQAFKQAGFADIRAKHEIKKHLEEIASLQPNYKQLKKSLFLAEMKAQSYKNDHEFKINYNAKVVELKKECSDTYNPKRELSDNLYKAENLLKTAEATNKENLQKIFILQLCLGTAVGGILGLYVHKAAQLIVGYMDQLEGDEIQEKRNKLTKFLTNDMFKPLLLISAGLGAYGSTLIK